MTNSRAGHSVSRRSFLTGAGAAGAGLLCGRLPAWSAEGASAKRPNVVFLLTDDQRADAMGCAGNPIIRTPNMDGLADDGIRFTNAFVTTSICMASRASIFTGQYERKHECTFGKPPLSPEDFAKTYPVMMRQAGYQTCFIGKFGVSLKDPKQYFDVWHGFGGQGKYENKDKQGNDRHLTSIMGDQAVDFIARASAKPDQPFCLSVSFKAPHVQDRDKRQFIPDPAYKDLYRHDTIPRPETATEEHFQRLPKFLQETEGRKRWKIRFATPEMFQRSVKNYYRLITGVDVQIGRIRDELVRRGLADNTIVVFSADNGFYLGERGLAGKWYGHEESMRVPMIVYDPRMPADRQGRCVSQYALNVDIAPTLLDLVGLKPAETMQGRSLVPLLHGKDVPWRDAVFYEHLFERHNIPKSEGVRTERWKYLRYFEQKPVYEELYDMQTDPHEEHNLAKDPDYAAKLAEMRKLCDQLKARAAGTMR